MINSHIILNAFEAAKSATNNHIVQHGEYPLGCGFAWVVARVRGNSKDGKTLKMYGFQKRYSGSGLMLWNPSQCMTQDMEAKYEGAKAFAKILRDAGIDAQAECRLD